VIAGGLTTLTDTTDNKKYYWCFQAHFAANQCRTSSCGSNTYSKTFITSSYWAGRRDNQWYDSDFDTCLANSGPAGEYQYSYSPSEKTCADNRCQQLCYDTYGSDCAASTAEISHRRSYVSYCYIYRGECSASENSLSYGHEGFSERNAAVQSYGAVYRENTATTFFCHEYARRRLSEDPVVEQNIRDRRSLSVSNGVARESNGEFDAVSGYLTRLLKEELANASVVRKMQRRLVELPDTSNYYGD
jgi:hypothetical protein